MVKIYILSLLLLATYSLDAQNTYKKPGRKALAVSGGGARGAWGLGVVRSLAEKEGGYQAVFGTSTGSLMAPMVLLQQFDKLEQSYTSVTQKSIFSHNPFKVKTVNGTVTTKLKTMNMLWRFITGKQTLGETKNLRTLISSTFTQQDYQLLMERYKTDSLMLAVAVTNMSSGKSGIRRSDQVKTYDRMVDWIWASANQPIFMSYTIVDDSAYNDGGVREVVALRAAVKYCVDNHLDTLEVVINDSQMAQDSVWSLSKSGNYFNGGLMRLLEVYNANTLFYNIWAGEVLTEYDDVSKQLSQGPSADQLTIIVYSMPYSLAATYRDELGFDKVKMKELLDRGKDFIQKKEYTSKTRQVYRARRIK